MFDDETTEAGAKERLSRRKLLETGAVAGAGLAALSSPLGPMGVALARRSEQIARMPLNPQDSVTLRFMTRGGPGYEAFFKDAANRFMKAHSNVAISIEPHDNDWDTKLKVEMAGGSPPDLVFHADDYLFSYAARGSLMDLAPFFKQAGLKKSDFWPAAINPQFLGNHLFAMPLDYGLHALFYNKALFDQQHISYPTDKWTWNDFTQAGRRLTLDRSGKRASDSGFDPNHVKQYGAQNGLYYWAGTILRSNGGSWATPDMTKATLDTPVAIKTFQWLADLGTRWFVIGSPLYAASQSFDIDNNNIAMQVDGTWKFSEFPHYPNLNWSKGNMDIAPIPLGSKGRVSGAEASGLVIPAGIKSTNAKWAWEFIKWMTTDEGQRVAFSYGVASIPNSPKLAQELIPQMKLPNNRKIILELLPQAQIPMWQQAISDQELENTLLLNPWSPAPEMLDLYKGRKTAAQAMPIVNKRIQKLLDNDQQLAKKFGVKLHL